jgi:hypothetical protein
MDQDERASNPEPLLPPGCLNCGAPLGGHFCASCGQRHETHPPTVGHLLGEVAETLTHADSRLWRTIRLLISKPGLLTVEFLAGRRERYLPPIRLYFILSFFFFLLLAFESEKNVTGGNAEFSGVVEKCQQLNYSGPFREKAEPRLRDACVRTVQDLQQGGERLSQSLLQGLPKAMFMLLPLFAALMSLFYWRPRRLYAEHLLFLVHNHSAAFLGMTIVNLLDRVIPASYGGYLIMLLLGWLVWYCYRGLRVFHGQSRWRTLAKLLPMLLLYTILAVMILTLTGIASALSI